MFRYKIVLGIVVTLGVVAVDQLAKRVAVDTRVQYVCNKGIAWGIELPQAIFYFLAGLFLVTIFGVYVKRKTLVLEDWGLLMILGGAIANIVSRLNGGCVVDFIKLPLWPSFNLADIAIVGGAILVIVELMGKKKALSKKIKSKLK